MGELENVWVDSNPNLINVVARALCRSAGYDPDGKQRLGGGCVYEENWTFFLRFAHVAIGAMLEPTQDMIKRATYDALVADAAAVWKTMINTALTAAEPN